MFRLGLVSLFLLAWLMPPAVAADGTDLSGHWVVSNDTGTIDWTINDNNGTVDATGSGSTRGQPNNYSCSGARRSDKLYLSCKYSIGSAYTNSAEMVIFHKRTNHDARQQPGPGNHGQAIKLVAGWREA